MCSDRGRRSICPESAAGGGAASAEWWSKKLKTASNSEDWSQEKTDHRESLLTTSGLAAVTGA